MSDEIDAVRPETDEARFAENLRRVREERGLSQGELAQKLRDAGWKNFHQMTVSRIERTDRPVRLGEARAIARILDTTVDVLTQPVEESRISEALTRWTSEIERRYGRIKSTASIYFVDRAALAASLFEAKRAGVAHTDPSLFMKAVQALGLEPEGAVKEARQEALAEAPSAAAAGLSREELQQLRELVVWAKGGQEKVTQRILDEQKGRSRGAR